MRCKSLIVIGLLCITWSLVLTLDSNSTPLRRRCLQNENIRCVDRQKINCKNIKYRKIDGSCNNPTNPAIGMAITAYKRLLPADYSDSIYAMPVAASGRDLPSARDISYKVFGRKTLSDPNLTHLNQQFGQIVTHDTSIRMPNGLDGLKPLEAKTRYCCTEYGRYVHRTDTTPCSPIPVSRNDPYFKNRDCIDFDRSVTEKDQKCAGTTDAVVPAEQLNGVTHYLDLSVIYGNSEAENARVRAFRDGMMKTRRDRRREEWPPQTNRSAYMCQLGDAGDTCYEFADPRGNQNLGLASLSIILLREHNRLARKLADINKHWDDETVFQEARRINIAQYQYITFYEWNPNFYGYKRMLDYGLVYNMAQRSRHVNDYDPCIDPRAIQSFMHASFRYFHNQIKPFFELAKESRVKEEKLFITRFQDKPGFLERKGKFDKFLRGMCTQHASLTDRNFDVEVSENFILGAGLRGRDLRAFDIQRARDHGVPKYNKFRELCGFRKARSWEDYRDFIRKKDIRLLRTIYESFEDVELSVGGALEKHQSKALVGPTFLCINMIQFKAFRKGDRYFFENRNQPYPFTEDQLRQIRKASIARIMCDNTEIERMQPAAFKVISGRNPLRKCSQLPEINLRYWRDRK